MNEETDALKVTTADNVTLWPLEHSGGRPIKLRISPEVPGGFDHVRFRNGQIVNLTLARRSKETPRTPLIPGTSLYAGIIFVPFGHFIAESLHRLWPIFVDPAMVDVRLVFHVWHQASFIFEKGMPSWMRDIFDILGVAQSRIMFLDKPLSFEKLVVPIQGSLWGLGPISAQYEAVFPPQAGAADKESAIVPGRRIYVSRSEYLFSGSYLGEHLVERILERDGKFEILHPQNHAVTDVLQKLQSCETAVFAEGSALHLLELFRHRPPNVFVICRRRTTEKFFGLMLHRMVSRVAFHHADSELAPLDFGKNGRPAVNNATALVNIASLVRRLAEFCGIELQEPSDAEIRQAQALSLLRYVLDPRSSGEATTHADLGRLLSRLRTQVSALDILPWSEQQKH